MQDFYQNEFRLNPVPDNVVAITKTAPVYTLTATARFQANEFFEATERLPEIALDVNRTPILNGPIYYEGTTVIRRSASGFRLQFRFRRLQHPSLRHIPSTDAFPPPTSDGFSIVPRAGIRETWYGDTRNLGNTMFSAPTNPLIPSFILPDPTVPIKYDDDVISDGLQRGSRGFFQNFARMGERAGSVGRFGRFEAYYPAVHQFLVGQGRRGQPRTDSPVRSLRALDRASADRLSAVHLH